MVWWCHVYASDRIRRKNKRMHAPPPPPPPTHTTNAAPHPSNHPTKQTHQHRALHHSIINNYLRRGPLRPLGVLGPLARVLVPQRHALLRAGQRLLLVQLPGGVGVQGPEKSKKGKKQGRRRGLNWDCRVGVGVVMYGGGGGGAGGGKGSGEKKTQSAAGRRKARQMDGWMDAWMDGWGDGWMGGWSKPHTHAP